MGRRPRQLLMVADGEHLVLPPEVATRAARAMGRLILQMLRVEDAQDPGEQEQGKGDGDDPRS